MVSLHSRQRTKTAINFVNDQEKKVLHRDLLVATQTVVDSWLRMSVGKMIFAFSVTHRFKMNLPQKVV
jgi:hypothetical protein